MILSPEELVLLTGKVRHSSQARDEWGDTSDRDHPIYEGMKPYKWLQKNKDKYLFDLSHIQSLRGTETPPCESGIYFLFVGDDLTYVGRSRYLSKRLEEHHKTMHQPHDCWAWIVAPDLVIQHLELNYWLRFKPPYNVVCPSGGREL